eukprot:6392422-Amphidinium_carterae.1
MAITRIDAPVSIGATASSCTTDGDVVSKTSSGADGLQAMGLSDPWTTAKVIFADKMISDFTPPPRSSS